MIGSITTSGVSASPLLKKSAATSASSKTSSVIEDKITISDSNDFSTSSPIEDFLPQGKHISTKKNFKTIKEYIAYMLLVYDRMKKLEPKIGEMGVKPEDKSQYLSLKNEIADLTQSNILG